MTDIEHPEYTEHKERWKDVRDLLCNHYENYVIPPETGGGRRTIDRNNAYVKRARFTNFTASTKNGLLGIATQEDPKKELPTAMEYLDDSATGNGLTLGQLYQWSLGETLSKGRTILLSDMPEVPEGVSGEESKIINAQPRTYTYKAEDMPIWEVTYINGKEVLTMAALREERSVREPGTFKYNKAVQYRILELDDMGRYYYYIVDKLDGPKVLQKPIWPKKDGQFWDRIPLTIIGAENNNAEPDNAPIWPIAHLNIGHLRNSASLEYNIEAHSRVTLGVTSDMSLSEWKEATDNKRLEIGSDKGIFLGKQGALHHFQVGPNQLASEEMKHKVEQMIMLGAHIITTAAANAPVETTRLTMGAKTGVLQSVVHNVGTGVLQQLQYHAEWLGIDPDSITFEVSDNFIPRDADPAFMQQLAAWVVQGIIPQSIPIQYGREVGFISEDTTDEDIINEINTENPLGEDTFEEVAEDDS